VAQEAGYDVSQSVPVQVLLSRSAREDDVVVGTENAGRGPPELAGVVGCLANLLALRTDLLGPHPRAWFSCLAAQLTETHGLLGLRAQQAALY